MAHDVIVIGAGIAGVAAAHYLLEAESGQDFLLIDREPPLSQTTSKSGENFRGPWPDPGMAALSERSIQLMEAIETPIGLKFSGYDFVSQRGGHDRFLPADDRQGIQQWHDPAAIHARFPYLAPEVREVTRLERAGVVDVNALGSALLRAARRAGARLLAADVSRLEASPGGYQCHVVSTNGEQVLECTRLVLAAGPFNGALAAQLRVDLPLENFLQRKIVVPDPLGIIPRDMPFTICADPLRLDWSDEERDLIAADPEFAWLLEEFPPGLHIKPEGAGRIKMGWAYNRLASAPLRDPPDDEQFADVVMRGASRFIPALRAYVEDMPTPVVSYAGYYTRTPENWPLIGPLGPPGLFTVAALSGFGTMVACAAGELLAAWMTDNDLPAYSAQFSPGRYADAEMLATMAKISSDGQL